MVCEDCREGSDAGFRTASVFRLATGEIGYRLFGVVMWAAAITSVVGSAYTSVSFLGDYRHPVPLAIAGAVVAVSMALMGGWTLWRSIG